MMLHTYLTKLLGYLLQFLQNAFQLSNHHFHAPSDALPFTGVAAAAAAASVVSGLPVLQTPGVHPSQGAGALEQRCAVHSAFAQPDFASTEPLLTGEISTF